MYPAARLPARRIPEETRMGLIRTLRRSVIWLSLGAAAGTVAVTARHLLETPQPLESALPGEGRIDRKHGGDVYYNVGGPEDALPLILLHDFYPGASNFEFRQIFARLTQRYRVYAPDWLGFGMSERPAVAYTGEFYASALSGFLRDVAGRPAVVVGHGRAANIAVRAAADDPALFERVILVAPDVFAGVMDTPTLAQTLVRASRRVSLGLVPYAMLSTRPALRRLTVRRSLRASEGVPADTTVNHLYASAHQLGGQYALLAALTGDLDLAMPNAFALLEPPVLIVSGERDRRHPRMDMEDIAILNPHADLDIIPEAGDDVFEDQPNAFVDAITTWLDTPASRHGIDEAALLQQSDALMGQQALEDEELEELEQEELEAALLMAEERDRLIAEADVPRAETASDDGEPPEVDAANDEVPETPASVALGMSDIGQEEPAIVDPPDPPAERQPDGLDMEEMPSESTPSASPRQSLSRRRSESAPKAQPRSASETRSSRSAASRSSSGSTRRKSSSTRKSEKPSGDG